MTTTEPKVVKSHTALFLTVSVLFGGNYMWAHFALQSFSALEVAWGRTVLAAATLAVVVLVTKDHYPRGKEIWIKLNVAALLFNTVSFVGMATAVSRITTVQVSIWNALVPLVTLGFVLVFIPEENPTWRRITGLSMGFLGAIFIAHPWSGLGDFDAFGTGAIMIGTTSYAAGLVYARRNFANVSDTPTSIAAGQMLCASIHLTLILPWFVTLTTDASTISIVSMLILGIVGTGITYIMIQTLIKQSGAGVASDTTYVILFVAIVLGIVVLGEELNVWQIIGSGFILIGLVIINRKEKTSIITP
ncbi:MAG: DMT family transporter [Candidatus Nanopelagicales bacterium]|jgi:drug/metabolite transporter (DMT)-like permease|nr:DMT family transporter [Candidatus Nanopelagicales bacterium]MDP4667007.1 DMT family transporter [Candidatus Nanopelagicales bacterium]MDP4895684.1 DMT family transporter [Candidatus Nanopelagicales bacterium]MDP5050520.1 DMT family transporter [Candidatus Nanopelagicales bacterium]